MIPSRAARLELGRRRTESKETDCKYCGRKHNHPQELRLHVFEEHWWSTRREMYEKEDTWLRARANGFK